jgi:predicted PurR-regulated permease PerM
LRRVLIVAGVATLLALAWQLAEVLLLAFGSVLVAVLLHTFANVISARTPVPDRWALAVASLTVFAVVLGIAALFGTQMRAQLAGVVEQLPGGLNSLSRSFGFGDISNQLPQMFGANPGTAILSRVAGLGATVLGGLTDFVLVVVAGLFIAADPKVYRRGLVKLFPPSQHDRVEGSLDASGEALRLWLISQLIAMAAVGILTTFAMWLIGLPSALALGLIAGFFEFIPFVGPILGAVPALLIAFTIDAKTALWTALAFVAIQQIESNVLFPIIEKRVVALPPALALFAIVAGGVLFGPVGLMVGFPLAVVVFTLVKKLYVRETLGEQTPVPGENHAAPT